MTILIKNARVLTLDDHGTEYAQADILIEGSQIVAIAPEGIPLPEGPNQRVIEAKGLLAMPGLINGHLHSSSNFQKGELDGLPLEIFMLYEVPPLGHTPPSPRLTYVRTMLSCMEMLKLGITAVHDDPFYVPIPTPAAIDGLMQAYADSGMRAVVTIDQPNLVEYEKYPFLRDLLPETLQVEMQQAPRMTTQELLDLYAYHIQKWHHACADRLRVAVSCSAPQRVEVDYLLALADLSQRFDLPFDMHILETKLQRVLGNVKFGKSLVKYVHDLGVLNHHSLVIHSVWVDEEDMELMAAAGCSIAHNPISNLRLGSGIMPFRQLRDYGINICLGSDEAMVDDTCNLWGVGKLAGLIHSLSSIDYHTWPKASEILWAMTRGGSQAMGYTGKTGILASGYEADLILLDLNTLAFTPLNDLHRQLVFCENGSSVVMTIVAGKIVVENGKILTVDEEAIKAEARELRTTIFGVESQAAQKAAVELEPYYRDMYLKAAYSDIGMNRWSGYSSL
ncbi:MAG: 5'-deoxyadenosine deaminase [Synechococcales cyanobacterium]